MTVELCKVNSCTSKKIRYFRKNRVGAHAPQAPPLDPPLTLYYVICSACVKYFIVYYVLCRCSLFLIIITGLYCDLQFWHYMIVKHFFFLNLTLFLFRSSGQTVSSQFDLNNQFPPLYFSPVRSFSNNPVAPLE